MNTSTTFLLAGALLGAASLDAAVTVNVAFDNSSAADTFIGAGVVGAGTDTWVAYDTVGAVESLGSGISIVANHGGGGFDGYYSTGVQIVGSEPITANYLYSETTLTVTLSGLNPSATYDLTAIASLDGYFDGSARTLQATGLNVVSTSLTNDSSRTTFADGVNYATLLGVQPTALGVIDLSLSSDVGLSALQIAIPEPATPAALAAAAAFALGAGHRRRSVRSR